MFEKSYINIICCLSVQILSILSKKCSYDNNQTPKYSSNFYFKNYIYCTFNFLYIKISYQKPFGYFHFLLLKFHSYMLDLEQPWLKPSIFLFKTKKSQQRNRTYLLKDFNSYPMWKLNSCNARMIPSNTNIMWTALSSFDVDSLLSPFFKKTIGEGLS